MIGDIPIQNAADFISVVFVLIGLILLLGGFNILDLEKIKVTRGKRTAYFGITGIVIGFSLLFFNLSIKTSTDTPTPTTTTIPNTTIPATSTPTLLPNPDTPTLTPALTMGWVTQTITPMKLVFRDKFIDNSNNWNLYDQEDDKRKVSTFIKNGVYNFLYTTNYPKGSRAMVSSSRLYEEKDFFLTLDLTLENTDVKNPENFGFFFEFRQTNYSYYMVEFNQEGRLVFQYSDGDDDWREIKSAYYDSLKIQKGVPLQFGILAMNNQFSFFSNGQLVASYIDPSDLSVSLPGDLAIGCIIKEANKSAQFTFDNVELREP